MAIKYVDLENGNDGTGTGTNLAPYKTQAKAMTVMVTNDEMRLAKNTTADTTISQSTVWTRNSLLVTVATDVTSTMAAGSYIGKPTAAGNGAFETFYRVASSSYSAGTGLTTVILSLKYIGATATTTSVIKKFIQTDTGNSVWAGTATVSFYEVGPGYREGIRISGGWNLATQTRDGETWWKGKNADWTTSWIAYTAPNGSANCTVEYMNVVETYNMFGTCTAVSTFTNRYNTIYQYVGASTTIFASEVCNNVSHSSVNTGIITQNNVGGAVATYNYLQCNSNGTQWFNYGATKLVFNNCLIASTTTVLDGYTAHSVMEFNNTVLLGTRETSTWGLNAQSVTGYYKFTGTSKIEYCYYGITSSTSTSGGQVFENPTTNYCYIGIYYGAQKFGTLVYNHTADSCSYCTYDPEVYSRNNVVIGTNYTNVIVKAFYAGSGMTAYNIVGGVWDAGTAAKLITHGTVSTAEPMYTISQLTGATNGIYWSTYRYKFYNNVYRATPPSYWFSTDALIIANYFPTNLWSGYVDIGEKKQVSVWVKTGGPSWAGTLVMHLTLNCLRLVTTTTTIVSDMWTKYTFNMPVAATVTGELALEVMVNSNIIDLFFDDFDMIAI